MSDQAEGLRAFVKQVGRSDGPYRDDLGNIVSDVSPEKHETASDYFEKLGNLNAGFKKPNLCTYFVKRSCTLSKAGHCPSRDRKDVAKCKMNGEATWCAVAMRMRK